MSKKLSPTDACRHLLFCNQLQKPFAFCQVLCVLLVALAGYRPWYAQGPSDNPFRAASNLARTSWKMQDLGMSAREEATGLLMTSLNETADAIAEVEGDNTLLDRARNGGPSENFSFPIMPTTEEEWQAWEGTFSIPCDTPTRVSWRTHHRVAREREACSTPMCGVYDFHDDVFCNDDPPSSVCRCKRTSKGVRAYDSRRDRSDGPACAGAHRGGMRRQRYPLS